MKRCTIAVCLLIVFLLCSCSGQPTNEGRLAFYYLSDNISYDVGESLLTADYRDVPGSLSDQLAAYLQGPKSDDMTSPFPEGVELVEVQSKGGTTSILLSREFSRLTGIDLSLACACLAKTCFSLTGNTIVEIRAEDAMLDGTPAITITPDKLLLTDSNTQGETT